MPEKTVNPGFRQRFEALKELKAQYMVSSQEAYNYLKMRRFLENLCDQINRNPAVQKKLTVREVSNFYNVLLGTARFWIQYLSLKFSTSEHIGIDIDEHSVLPEIDYLSKEELYKNTHEWKVDYYLFCERFFESVPTWCLDISRSKELQKIILSFLATVGYAIPCFVYIKTGAHLSSYDIEINTDLRKTTVGDFWDCIGAILCSINISPKTRALLIKAEKEGNLALAHKIVRRVHLSILDPAMFIEEITETSIEEQQFLLDIKRLYERAEREYTLRTFMVERRIALGIIFTESPSGISPESAVDYCINNYLERRKRWQVRLAEWKIRLGPESLDIEITKRRLEMVSYMYLALKKNRKWLIEFFSK